MVVGSKGREILTFFLFSLGCILEAQFDMLRNNYYTLRVILPLPLFIFFFFCIYYFILYV